jgi:glycosyltransferase involved in cell wall biosynthesis
VRLTGRLDHDDLADLLPACEAQVVPSTFPEAFGMVAAEAAACGALPLSAAHSGLAEVTAALAEAVDPDVRPLLSFDPGPEAVEQIAARLVAWLTLEAGERARASEALAALARERFGWEGVARGVLAAASGRLDELVEPGAAPRAIRPANG